MALRLVNRQWEDASTPFVFEHVHVRLFASSREKFDQLCRSELARFVKRDEFHPDLLPSWDKDTWLSKVDLRPELDEWMFVRDSQEQRRTQDAHDKLPRHSLSTDEIDKG